ncbi:hypothetical protein E0H26_26945 [Micromonospora zingiberis]|uniref:Uncharacterized protein n=1 Tax=Micromonospora zingiberis TaxID=2053011 RepID=A0A4R0G1P0_9ACTN|nr:hypothetical protein [Micromonospora zingiberis]TCB90464.1 hypothetical protein E0H26_26945 [Micromonospora zingiberis]
MKPTRYIAERIAVTSEQLASWQAQLSRTELTLRGPCPKCGDITSANLPRTAAVLEANAARTPDRLTAVVECECRRPHRGRPADAVSEGCGRSWGTAAVFEADGTVTLRPPAEPTLVEAADAFRLAQAGQLAAVRASADRWTTGVTALISLAALILPVAGRDAIRALQPWAQAAIGALLVVAIATAAVAVLRAYRAAHGLPAIRLVDDDKSLLDWYTTHRARPVEAVKHLRQAIQAALATVVALAVAVGLAVFGPARPVTSAPVQLTLTDGSLVCGLFLTSTADVRLRVRRADDGAVAVISVSDVVRIKPVKAC